MQLTQQLQSVNAHLEHYHQVCVKVQTLEGAYLFLVRIIKNGIDESLIAEELQRISRPVLSLQELANVALTNPTQVFDHRITPEFLAYVQTFADGYHELSLDRTGMVHPAQMLNDNPRYRCDLFDY